VDIAHEFYNRTAVGSSVCVYLWRGAFGARWFKVARCDAG